MKLTRLLPAVCAFVLLTAMVGIDVPKEILLWPNGAPGSEGKTDPEKKRVTDQGDIVISSVSKPSIAPFIPSAEKSTDSRSDPFMFCRGVFGDGGADIRGV